MLKNAAVAKPDRWWKKAEKKLYLSIKWDRKPKSVQQLFSHAPIAKPLFQIKVSKDASTVAGRRIQLCIFRALQAEQRRGHAESHSGGKRGSRKRASREF